MSEGLFYNLSLGNRKVAYWAAKVRLDIQL